MLQPDQGPQSEDQSLAHAHALPPDPPLPGPQDHRAPMLSRETQLIALWLIATLTAVVMALNFTWAAHLDGEWVPVGNDSFYHARRILDAAADNGTLVQFDKRIHVPEGSWLT